jgi:two-component sensor histidine kinase
MKPGRPGRAPALRDVRSRVLFLLFAIIAPVLALGLIWAMHRDLAARRLEFYATKTATTLVATRIERLVQQVDDLADMPLVPPSEGCAAPVALLARHPDFDAGFLVAPTADACAGLPPEILAQAREHSPTDRAPSLLGPAADTGGLYLAGAVGAMTGHLLILHISPAALDRSLELQRASPASGVALIGATGLLAERHLPDAPANWWPAAMVSPPRSDRIGLESAGAQPFQYLVVPIATAPPTAVATLRIRPPFATERWRALGLFAAALAVLVALGAGTIWAIERSVLRWIVYLRRIATAHSRGHHSVRAKTDNAPSELAALGQSLNHMANDAGHRAALLRETAEEKSALLLELHHRVKNNLQVITSLLSLHRHDMPPERREEIRFVEDYVRTMAVAYRVAYDAGDVTGTRLQDLLRHVIATLRESTEAPSERIELTVEVEPIWIDLDKAISLGLYLAATLPPYLKALTIEPAATLRVVALRRNGMLRLSAGGLAPVDADRPPLRAKLLKAYLRQLKAVPTILPGTDETIISFPLDSPTQAHRLASITRAAEVAPSVPEATRRGSVVEAAREREQRLNLLMREMAHRSKNILAVTEAIARQSLAQASTLEDFGEQFSARLHSLAESHDLLTQVEWAGTRLHDLIRSQLGHYLDDSGQIVVEGPDLSLGPNTVPYVGLALHELSTNAAKHGALSVPEGHVTIRWGIAVDPEHGSRLRLSWTETDGPPVVPPTRRGFGTDVTRRLVARALRGRVELDFAEAGIIWRLDAPTTILAEQPARAKEPERTS